MKKIYFIVFAALLSLSSYAQVVVCTPAFPSEQDSAIIIFDATQGSGGLADWTGDVYAHTGVITNLSTSGADWKYVIAGWSENIPKGKLQDLGNHKYKFSVKPTIREFYGVPAAETILKMAFVFRSSDGEHEGKNTDGSDIMVDVYEAGLHINLVQPSQSPLIVEIDQQIPILATVSESATISLFVDNLLVISVVNDTLDYSIVANANGKHWIKIQAEANSLVAYDSIYFFVKPATTIEELPSGMVSGINYLDNQTVTLVLHDPPALKHNAFVIGDFNNWELDEAYFMKRTQSGEYYWLTINNLTSGTEYAYQYLVDGTLRLADPYSNKILDPWNDKWIPATTYPNLKPYPAGKTQGVVSVFQTAQQPYQWQTTNFQAPASQNLVAYELLIRDFVGDRRIKSVKDTLDYLQRLGVNAIELMPFSEFEGNDSWGYNPDFYFATDKAYGTETDYKEFIDECHSRGIAVIQDMVLNHSFGLSPMVQMYFDGNPTEENPWFNRVAMHPYNVGYDFDHESIYTKNFVKRVVNYWLTEYKIDGFRFDLSKGFTQKNSGGDVGMWGQFDQGRINIWLDYSAYIKSVNPNAYIILEHFADNSEEKVLSNAGMMLWGNMTGSYGEASIGNTGSSDLSWISYKSRGWTNPNVVGYMESHDEERMQAKNLHYGKQGVNYNIKDSIIAQKRIELCAAFFYTIPGPKMLWQFGELAYDFWINYPGVMGQSDNRLTAKPVRWDYVRYRKQLYNVHSALLHLKTENEAFNTTDFTISIGASALKSIHLNHATMNVTILGNFGVSSSPINPQFQSTGWWYEYISGDSLNVTSTSAQIALKPGEYKIYTSIKLARPELLADVPMLTELSNRTNVILYPNPVSDKVTFEFNISKPQSAKLFIYNQLGQTVNQVDFTRLPSGINTYEWNLSGLNGVPCLNGIYIYQLQVGTQICTGKFVLQR